MSDSSSLQRTNVCGWCQCPMAVVEGVGGRPREFCGQLCRQRAFRLRRRLTTVARNARPMRFAYADPPYPGKAWMYRDQPSYAGEVDHVALIASLRASYDGWGLSTSRDALRWILPLCPEDAIVCPWVKPHGASTATYGVHNCWEPLIVVPGRELRPGKRDWLSALPARLEGETLIGRKPKEFCAWLFEVLGMLAGDELHDLYPGTGMVGRCWNEWQRAQTKALASLPASDDETSLTTSDDETSLSAENDRTTDPG